MVLDLQSPKEIAGKSHQKDIKNIYHKGREWKRGSILSNLYSDCKSFDDLVQLCWLGHRLVSASTCRHFIFLL